jgi:hypothetical protein
VSWVEPKRHWLVEPLRLEDNPRSAKKIARFNQ